MRSVLLLIVFLFATFATCHLRGFDQCSGSNRLLYRTYDGSYNNLLVPEAGKAGTFYGRGPEGAEFADDVSVPVTNRPAERAVSNAISRNDPNKNDPIPHSLLSTQFGQFVNHDVNNNRLDDPLSFVFPTELQVPDKDDEICWIFANPSRGNLTLINACLPPLNQIPLIRAKKSGGEISNGVFQVYNNATAWLDLSQIYGPSAEWNALIRTHQNGLLATGDYVNYTVNPSLFRLRNLNSTTFTLLNGPPSFATNPAPVDNILFLNSNLPGRIFTSGDERVGENPALSMFHTLFIREHNRIARNLKAENPSWDDEHLFEEARRLNIAQYQAIVMYEYVPQEFGQYFYNKHVGNYGGYDLDRSHSIPLVFASAAFRYGHSTFRNYVPLDRCGQPTLLNQPAQGQLLTNAGQTGGGVMPLDGISMAGSYENLIRGLISTRTEPNDVQIANVLRSIPFRAPVAGGTDIWALDLSRARVNGVPNYNALRKVYFDYSCDYTRCVSGNGVGSERSNIYGSHGCPSYLENRPEIPDPIACFRVLSPHNTSLATSLQQLYQKVNRIDALIGLLIEPQVPGTSFSRTLGNIIVSTYANMRNEDRFWFENRWQPNAFSKAEIAAIRQTRLSQLLQRNFDFPSPLPRDTFSYATFQC